MPSFISSLLHAVAWLALTGPSNAQNPHIPGEIPSDLHEPLQHRMAFAGPHGMTISWNTFARLDEPRVYYGEDPIDLCHSAVGHSTTYPTSRTWNNHVKLTGLKPCTKYYYFVSHTNCQGCQTLPEYSFTTSKTAGDHTTFRMGVVIDLGVMGKLGLSTMNGTGPDQTSAQPLGLNETDTIQSLNQFADAYDFLMHPGDIAYADYWLKQQIQNYIPGYIPGIEVEDGIKYEEALETYYDQMQPITARKPYMVGPGNHEANCDNGHAYDSVNNFTYGVSICLPGQTNFTGYINHWRMPGAESGGKDNFWYSFDYGMAHFVMLDAETDLGGDLIGPSQPGGSYKENAGPFGSYPNEQIDWVKKDLAAVDRTITPWVIVMFHRPWYTNNLDPMDICDVCQAAFEDILYDNEVDLVMSGHVHNYQRQIPVHNNITDPNNLNNPRAPWYIVNGIGGQFDGPDPLDLPLKHYTAVAQDEAYGWSLLTFHNKTHLTHQFIYSGNGTVGDTATLFKDR